MTVSTKQAPAFPPAAIIPDTIATFKSIDWVEMRARAQAGLNNIGLVLAVIGEKIHDCGCFLAEI